jgi:MOSC domain-containing protein YiiM
MRAMVVAVCVSKEKGVRKTPVAAVELKREHGINGDAHAGPWHRQVSLLALESIQTMQATGLDVTAGDFAENITTQGIDLVSLPIGTQVNVGSTIVEVTQIGKVCHNRCAIYYQAGDCVMPREGIFARVLKGGTVLPNDRIEILGTAQPLLTIAADIAPALPRFNNG